MNDFTLFLGKFLRHGTAIASVAPSSRWLVANDGPQHRLGQHQDSGRARRRHRSDHASDRGPGRPECRVMVDRARPRFRSASLCDGSGRLPNFEIVEGDVRDLTRDPRRAGDRVGRPRDLGLAGAFFPRRAASSPFSTRSRAVLRPEGTYNQITEIPWLYWGFYRRYFEDVRFVFEPRNLPPAGAYFCRRPRQWTECRPSSDMKA